MVCKVAQWGILAIFVAASRNPDFDTKFGQKKLIFSNFKFWHQIFCTLKKKLSFKTRENLDFFYALKVVFLPTVGRRRVGIVHIKSA